VIDAIREQPAPFDPDATTQEFAGLLALYGLHSVRGDRYGGLWPRERFAKYGISYRVADKTKSELYQALLPRLNAGTIELPDNDRLIKQLLALERRTSRGGRDSIDHPSSSGARGRDDVANAIAGCAYELRDGQRTIATITVKEVESARDMMRRCAAMDEERRRQGRMDEFLNKQAWTPAPVDWRDAAFARSSRRRVR